MHCPRPWKHGVTSCVTPGDSVLGSFTLMRSTGVTTCSGAGGSAAASQPHALLASFARPGACSRSPSGAEQCAIGAGVAHVLRRKPPAGHIIIDADHPRPPSPLPPGDDESRAAAKILRRRVEMRGKSGVFRAPPRKKRRAGTALLRGSHCAGLEAARGFPSCAAVADFAGGRFGAKRPGGRRRLGEFWGSIFTHASPKLSTHRERAR